MIINPSSKRRRTYPVEKNGERQKGVTTLVSLPWVLGLAGKNTSRGSWSDSIVDAYEVNFYIVMLLQCIRCVFDGVCAEEKCVFSHGLSTSMMGV